MRIVYDDEMQNVLVYLVNKFMSELDIKSVVAYEWGTDRVQMNKFKEKLNKFLGSYSMEIGNKATHAYGIGNNCNYPVYFYSENETQHCANININTGMYGEGYVSVEDYNGKRVGITYELRKHGIKSL